METVRVDEYLNSRKIIIQEMIDVLNKNLNNSAFEHWVYKDGVKHAVEILEMERDRKDV